MIGIKNNYTNKEMANPLADVLICLCRSHGGVSIELKWFHKQLNIACRILKQNCITRKILNSNWKAAQNICSHWINTCSVVFTISLQKECLSSLSRREQYICKKQNSWDDIWTVLWICQAIYICGGVKQYSTFNDKEQRLKYHQHQGCNWLKYHCHKYWSCNVKRI